MHRAVIILVMLALVGCATSGSPKARQLIGRFVGDDGSHFVLTADRKVTYHSISAVWRDAKATENQTISGSGTWRIADDLLIAAVCDDDSATGQFVTRKIEIFEVQPGRWGLILPVDTGQGSSYALFYIQPYRR
jgi:hypothetical protein